MFNLLLNLVGDMELPQLDIHYQHLLTTYQLGCTFKYHTIEMATQTPNDPGWHTQPKF
jgi:hypothetical protein